MRCLHLLVYADWCGPCKAIAPMYEQLSASLSRPNKITFVKINTETQKEVAAKYAVTAYVLPSFYLHLIFSTFSTSSEAGGLMRKRGSFANMPYVCRLPTFIIFKQAAVVERVQGADLRKLQDVVRKLAAEADGTSSGFAGGSSAHDWRLGELPRGYSDITDQVDVKGLELLNADSEFGGVRVLFEGSKPSALTKGKGKENATRDWVESDTDEQLMLYVPFQALLKVHTLQVSSLPMHYYWRTRC